MNCEANSCKRNGVLKAFTLVELLSVLGIIVILFSLLLPALVRAKASVRKVNCLNRMKQWNLALTMHGHDNQGNIPRESFIPGGTTINLWAQVRNPLASDVWYNALPVQLGVRQASSYAPMATRGDFYSSKLFFHCPSALFPPKSGLNEVAFFSYAMNSKLILRPFSTVKLSSIIQPSDTVTFLENRLPEEKKIHVGQVDDHLGQPSAFATRFVARHQGKGVMAFADGHVDVKAGERVVADGRAISPQVEIIWTCNPDLNPNRVE